MDKLQEWEARILQAPRAEVANIDYVDLLVECRILDELLFTGAGEKKLGTRN